MRTNIVIDDALMEAAMRAGGFSTKKEAVEEGLRLLARRKAYQDLRALRGKLTWAGDDSVDWTTLEAEPMAVQEQPARYAAAAPKPTAARKRTKP
ncbi:type II toxin-antitoxin system VapB family antitoxin [Pseudacidovorax intermedius]|uniref:VapB protein of antitoxin of type II toxin-antitoxin system n=1 Tax=Pseudacidovorax intermedius TaxID=433924 RepID=A0A370F5B3_9BURK|nr:type II toxin-antitoxin system VapB family antitoxin [Pseudacidovorax intermedius]RDI18580.1 VapB protein of antitoxin of type II toxin-antitoxin system [Pseudacidovorax intermedius]